jgi:hypothetical protein
MNVTCDIHVITFTSDKCFGPDDTSQKRKEWNEMRQKKDLHITIPTIHGTATNFDFLMCAGYVTS